MLISNETINILFLVVANCGGCEKLDEVSKAHEETAIFFILSIDLGSASNGPLLTIIGPITCPLLHTVRITYLD